MWVASMKRVKDLPGRTAVRLPGERYCSIQTFNAEGAHISDRDGRRAEHIIRSDGLGDGCG